MNIQEKKLSLIEWLLSLEDEKTLEEIEELRSGSDFWDELTEGERKEIDQGLEELDRGEAHDHEEVAAKHRGE